MPHKHCKALTNCRHEFSKFGAIILVYDVPDGKDCLKVLETSYNSLLQLVTIVRNKCYLAQFIPEDATNLRVDYTTCVERLRIL